MEGRKCAFGAGGNAMQIVCLGEMLIDLFASETGRDFGVVSAFLPVPGGAPANVAVAASRLGTASAFIGKVGDDPFGRKLASVLAENGVETGGMLFDLTARTTLNFMSIPDVNTVVTFFYRNPGADMLLRPEELNREMIRGARFFHFGSVSLTEEPCRSATFEAARVARQAGVPVSFDVNYRPSLWPQERALPVIHEALGLADLVKVNETELAMLAGEGDTAACCSALLQAGPRLCVATLGPRGSVWATREAHGEVKGFTVQTVDATGCGDAFSAALLCRLISRGAGRGQGKPSWGRSLESSSLAECVTYANAAGALTATKKGVIPSLPFAKEVDAFMQDRRDEKQR
jgi:fructokinase